MVQPQSSNRNLLDDFPTQNDSGFNNSATKEFLEESTETWDENDLEISLSVLTDASFLFHTGTERKTGIIQF